MEDILVPIVGCIAVFGSLTAICVLPGFFKHKSQREMQKTVRASIAQGHSLPPELIEVLTRDVRKGLPSRARDVRRGVMLVSTAIGVALLGQFSNFGINTNGLAIANGLLGVACVPFCIGLAYLVLSRFNKNVD